MKRHCWCWICWIETNRCFFIEHLLRLSSSPAQSWSRGTPEIWTQPRLRLGFIGPRINWNDFATHEWTFNISCAFSEWRTRLVASTVLRKSQELEYSWRWNGSFPLLPSLCFSHANSQRSIFETRSICQVKGEITSIAAFGVFVNIGAEKDGLDLTSSVWNWSRLILLEVCFRGPSPGNPETLWSQRLKAENGNKWQMTGAHFTKT